MTLPPEIMRLSIDPDEHLVQVPAPLRKRLMKASLPDRGRKHRTTYRSGTEPSRGRCGCHSLEQKILDLSQRQRIADIHHHHEADHLGRAVEITEVGLRIAGGVGGTQSSQLPLLE